MKYLEGKEFNIQIKNKVMHIEENINNKCET